MSYQVLARKWRPKNFQSMVGQEHILRMLANALEQKRLHHAYLFTGTRGVGKTTLARILAKCLNCDTGVTSSPCGQCHACKAIDAGQFLDLYEVDAASRTKVEDTRDLLDNVLYPPTQGRYKIYLIDEIHMLSTHSFNALLKTLEEPPEHVKFLFATTDIKRIPVTILSRCLQFHLKHITPEQIAKHLQHVCTSETIPHEVSALDRLARAAEGSMRDALSLLDQAIAYGQGSVNKAEINSMLGCMAQDDLLPLLQALLNQDGKQMFACIRLLAEDTQNFQQALEELISLFHQIAILQILPSSEESQAPLLALAQSFTPEEVQLYYQIALLGRRDLSLTPSPQQGFEMTLLRMLAFKPSANIEIEKINTHTVSLKPKKQAQPIVLTKQIITPQHPQPIQAAADQASDLNLSQWRDLLPKLELSGMAYALAANCSLEKIIDNKVILTVSASHQPMLNAKLKERLAEALSRQLKQTMQLEINVTSSEIITPIKQQQSEQAEQLTQAKQRLMQTPQIKTLLEMYDATMEVSLV